MRDKRNQFDQKRHYFIRSSFNANVKIASWTQSSEKKSRNSSNWCWMFRGVVSMVTTLPRASTARWWLCGSSWLSCCLSQCSLLMVKQRKIPWILWLMGILFEVEAAVVKQRPFEAQVWESNNNTYGGVVASSLPFALPMTSNRHLHEKPENSH